jgi:hypothetical protein
MGAEESSVLLMSFAFLVYGHFAYFLLAKPSILALVAHSCRFCHFYVAPLHYLAEKHMELQKAIMVVPDIVQSCGLQWVHLHNLQI